MDQEVSEYLNYVGQAVAFLRSIDLAEVNEKLDIVSPQLPQEYDDFRLTLTRFNEVCKEIKLEEIERFRIMLEVLL